MLPVFIGDMSENFLAALFACLLVHWLKPRFLLVHSPTEFVAIASKCIISNWSVYMYNLKLVGISTGSTPKRFACHRKLMTVGEKPLASLTVK